jgi:hypothetical protein
MQAKNRTVAFCDMILIKTLYIKHINPVRLKSSEYTIYEKRHCKERSDEAIRKVVDFRIALFDNFLQQRSQSPAGTTLY